MKHAKPIGIALLLWLPELLTLGLLAPVAVLVALPFAKWGPNWTEARDGTLFTKDGHLPAWAWWLATPDHALPGELDLNAVYGVYKRFGWFACSWYWLGLRNRLQGLAFFFAVRLPVPFDPGQLGYQEQPGGLWWLRQPIFGGRLQLKAGYRQYVVDGAPFGVPTLTITKA